MSNYLDKIDTGFNRNTARLARVIGGDVRNTTLANMLERAKNNAPRDVTDGVGTLAGAVAGAIIGQRYNHPVLGSLAGASLGRNVPALLRPAERKMAMRNLLMTHSGVAGSLVFNRHPVVGFFLGTVAGGLAAYAGGMR